MTEKQIYDRLNRCYMNYFVGNDKEIQKNDEWFGEDDVRIWHWRRPKNDTEYRLMLNAETKEITDERKIGNGKWRKICTYTTRQYFVAYPGEKEFRNSDDYPYRK